MTWKAVHVGPRSGVQSDHSCMTWKAGYRAGCAGAEGISVGSSGALSVRQDGEMVDLC